MKRQYRHISTADVRRGAEAVLRGGVSLHAAAVRLARQGLASVRTVERQLGKALANHRVSDGRRQLDDAHEMLFADVVVLFSATDLPVGRREALHLLRLMLDVPDNVDVRTLLDGIIRRNKSLAFLAHSGLTPGRLCPDIPQRVCDWVDALTAFERQHPFVPNALFNVDEFALWYKAEPQEGCLLTRRQAGKKFQAVPGATAAGSLVVVCSAAGDIVYVCFVQRGNVVMNAEGQEKLRGFFFLSPRVGGGFGRRWSTW